MKRPPLLIHPGSQPVSASSCISRSRVEFRSWVKTSSGRNLQTIPADCQVVPEEIFPRSKSTALTPRFTNWYNVWHPAVPPPDRKKGIIGVLIISMEHFRNKYLVRLWAGTHGGWNRTVHSYSAPPLHPVYLEIILAYSHMLVRWGEQSSNPGRTDKNYFCSS